MTLGSMELYRGVHTAQRQMTTQIPIESSILAISLGLSPATVSVPTLLGYNHTEKNECECEHFL